MSTGLSEKITVSNEEQQKFPIILFDGVCNYCCSSVMFIIKRDPREYYRFAQLQSEAGKALMNRHGLNPEDLSSLILIEDGKVFKKSEAALRVSRELGGFWTALSYFLLLPAPLRDMIYDIIARNRYKLFGRKEDCMIPAPDIKQRFLD